MNHYHLSQFLASAMFLLFSLTASGQNLTFQDARFKLYLTSGNCVDLDGNGTGDDDADLNNDGEIQVSEALVVTRLKVGDPQITSYSGIEGFSNLEYLDCSWSTLLPTLDIQGLPNLKYLDCNGCRTLTSLDLSAFPQLETLNCGYCKITTLSLNGLTHLKHLDFHQNKMTSFDARPFTQLEYLNTDQNDDLATLNVEGLLQLKELICSNNKLSSLNVQGLTNLEKLDCNNNELNVLIVYGLTKLKYLGCGINNIINLNLQGLTQLTFLYCGNNELYQLNLQDQTKLQELYCGNNQLATLNVQGLYDLGLLQCQNNQLTSLYIKNGNRFLDGMYFVDNSQLAYICCDEEKLDYVKHKATVEYGLTNCIVNTYCTIAPGGVYYTAQGQAKWDLNENGCGVEDAVYPNLKYKLTTSAGPENYIGDGSGYYNMVVKTGTNTITPLLENPAYFAVTPTSVQVQLPADTNQLTHHFCITPNGTHHDLEISLLPLTPARPGFEADYQIVYKNKGNQLESGVITFSYEEDLMEFISASKAPDSIASGNLFWNFSQLYPLDKGTIVIRMRVNSPFLTPPVLVGDLLSIGADVQGVGSDEVPVDNFASLRQVVVGSNDPNDKTCVEGNTITPDRVGEYLHYMIRFENTGTYHAENVIISDVIDTTKFVLSSLQLVESSHTCYVRTVKRNQLEFVFENINLPFTEPDKHGFVAFKIKTKSSLVLGSQASNQANIYFDYNLPVATNIATTVVANVVSTQSPANQAMRIQLQPNPATDVLFVVTEQPVEKVEVFDALGKLVAHAVLQDGQINMAGWSPGTYVVKVYGKEGFAVERVVKR